MPKKTEKSDRVGLKKPAKRPDYVNVLTPWQGETRAPRAKKKAVKEAEHIIVSTIWQGALLCFHCGGRYDVAFPVPLDIMVSTLKTFEKGHRKCRQAPPGVALKEDHDEAFRGWIRKRRMDLSSCKVVLRDELGFTLHRCDVRNGLITNIHAKAMASAPELALLKSFREGKEERRIRLPEDDESIVEVWF